MILRVSRGGKHVRQHACCTIHSSTCPLHLYAVTCLLERLSPPLLPAAEAPEAPPVFVCFNRLNSIEEANAKLDHRLREPLASRARNATAVPILYYSCGQTPSTRMSARHIIRLLRLP